MKENLSKKILIGFERSGEWLSVSLEVTMEPITEEVDDRTSSEDWNKIPVRTVTEERRKVVRDVSRK